MRLSVWCAEELPFADTFLISSIKKAYPAIEGYSPVVFEPDICDIWNVDPAAATENQPIQSNIPTLFINGSLDPDTPPKWATQMLTNFPKGHQVIFPGWGHTPTTNWGNPCGMAVANTFFNDPSKVPDLDCLQEIGPISFKLK